MYNKLHICIYINIHIHSNFILSYSNVNIDKSVLVTLVIINKAGKPMNILSNTKMTNTEV